LGFQSLAVVLRCAHHVPVVEHELFANRLIERGMVLFTIWQFGRRMHG
jgi:hypothetical protein